MPIYEYRCKKCSSHFEVIQKFSDNPLRICSNCKGRLSKLISKTSFQLKGSGWYVTDYAKSVKAAAKQEETSKPATESPAKNETPSRKEPTKKAK
ncbi:MAG: zinc ribbon domain-containing protein [Acidobacteria bacterium]|nr:zinc ribbon domain-containing protein [Acidobacteriota bacterium]MCI0620196.1 zinc ribbon domain-containing protein [Acidobacteriota bacterium]MCI0720294.1 zinc ribbon domain-containing protein [Acidobacteriota bacterium]